jgi:hypothetical protein
MSANFLTHGYSVFTSDARYAGRVAPVVLGSHQSDSSHTKWIDPVYGKCGHNGIQYRFPG